MFFDCGMAQSAPEWFHRKRGILKACRMMNAVTRWQPAILEGELPGEIGNARERVPVARALRPSSTVRSLSGLDHRPTQGLQKRGSQNHDSAASTGKCGTPERWRTSTVVPTLLAAGRQDERSTNDAARVAGPGRICFLENLFAADWSGSARTNQVSRSDGAALCLRTCFRGASTA